MRSFPLARTALAAGLLLAAGLPAQDLGEKVATLLQHAESAPLSQAFQLGHDAAELGSDTNTDPLRDALVKAMDKAGPKARIAAAIALQNLKEDATYGRDIIDALKPVTTADDAAVRAAAMALLGDEHFFNKRVLPEVQKLLDGAVKDELVPPEVRAEASVSLWRLGTNEQRGTAKSTLTQFLASQDRDLQVRGALALADINAVAGKAAEILRAIQHEPTDTGRRAAAYLKSETERREFEATVAKLIEERSKGGAPDTGSDGKFAVLQELMARVHAMHINGRTVKDDELVEYAAKGMLAGLDPHSTYFTSDEFQRFFFDLNREYGGIGAFVNFDENNDFAITRPIYSGPAYRAGLLSGDKILEVDGWETANRTNDEIISRLKGKPDSTVVIKVFRPGWTAPQDISIVRAQITVPCVSQTMLPGDIGYIELITFSTNTNEELDAALKDLTGKGAKGLVLDLRNNTGGYLTQAAELAEKFISGKKLVVYTEGPSERKREYRTRDRGAVCDLPLAVLVNNFSASASEITAGAMQDLGRAVIIGERTYGKGSVQNYMGLRSQPGEEFTDLNNDGVWEDGEPYVDSNGNHKYDVGPHIKLTVAKYYLPSGRCPHKEFDKNGKIVDPNWGVTPDTVVDLLDHKPEDGWKNAAVFALLRKNVFRDYVKKQLPEHKELFLQLAEGDDGDASRYPDFDAFYAGLSTQLPKDDVRKWTRYEVRDQVSDLRSKVYPGVRALGDPQEDVQLQEAVRQLLKKTGTDIRTITAYQKVLKIKFGEEQSTGKK